MAFSYTYRNISESLIQQITQVLESGVAPESGASIEAQLNYVQKRGLVAVGAAITLLAALFAYIISRITLRPTRSAFDAQKQFIGNVAHELRTPISIIKTNTEVTLMESNLPPSMEETLRSNIEEIDRISEIINNLLSINSLLRPERVEFHNVDLGTIVDAVVTKLWSLAQRKDIEITVRKSDARLVWGNSAALEQITMNLLKNAINYTPPAGHIMVTIEPNYRGFIELMIQDTGIGIDRKELFHIFEPFYRGDQSRVRRHGGSGLGLTIVSELTKLHRGRISIMSRLKQGTRVMVTLPGGQALSNELRTINTAQRLGGEEITVDFSKSPPRNRI